MLFQHHRHSPNRHFAFYAPLLVLAAMRFAPAQEPQEADAIDSAEPRIVFVNRIWDRAKHNAFTDLVHFGEKWFCVFREGSGHVSDSGKLRVISSGDGQTWSSAALISMEEADLRDAKITVTPAGQLMLSGAAAYPDSSNVRHQSMTWFSSDGENWSRPHLVGDHDVWLWRSTWHRSAVWGIGYGTSTKKGTLRLYRSDDGQEFQTHVPQLVQDSYPNETSIVFGEDDQAFCLLRRDGTKKSAMLGVASPPYRQWQWNDLGVRVGGPHMIRLPDDRLVAAVRLYDRRVRTSLCWIDTKDAELTEFLELPSGGDTSYAGLVWHDEHLWVSYYSGHERGKTVDGGRTLPTTSIYLAKISIPRSQQKTTIAE